MDKIKTKSLFAVDVRVGLRVMVKHGFYKNQVGTITSIFDNNSCEAGWCVVFINNNFKKFRYGYRDGETDLLQITKEPEQQLTFVTAETAKIDTIIKVWNGSEIYYDFATKGNGIITSVSDDNWASVEFISDGSKEDFPFEKESLTLLLIKEGRPETEEEKKLRTLTSKTKITPKTANIGTKVKISERSKYFRKQGHHGVGEIILKDNDSAGTGWVRVKFDDGYCNCYRYGRTEVDKGVSDLVPA
jgi:hypothetical protein